MDRVFPVTLRKDVTVAAVDAFQVRLARAMTNSSLGQFRRRVGLFFIFFRKVRAWSFGLLES